MKRVALGVTCLLWALPMGAYYHFIHYTSKTAPYNPVPEKFDLTALPNKTLTVFVSSNGPQKLAGNDGLPSVLTQIKQAALAWNNVATSDIRVAFGGLFVDGTAESTPAAEIVFDDEIPPGLLAYTVPVASSTMVTQGNDSFFPISQSVIHLHSDLTRLPGPSYFSAFYRSMVHEIGHALGLQHTFTSSAMSVLVTNATSTVQPLDTDDIVGLSLLYPRNFGANSGSITGTVTAGGNGVHLASVVALRPNAPAISALTNPDGTYEIDGVPPGAYLVYVNPLPPTANIIPPVDPDGNNVNPTGNFNGVFYPNTTDTTKAAPVNVTAGASTDGINFAVSPRHLMPVYDISTYSYYGQNGSHPAYANLTAGSATIAAAGIGLGSNGQMAATLNVTSLGSTSLPAGGFYAYGSTPTYLAMNLNFSLGASPGPQHFIFTQQHSAYVLPRGLNLVTSDPPSISNIATDGNGNLVVTGANFTPQSQVYFDGLPASTSLVDNSHLSAVPPPGASGQNAAIIVYNSDGQDSTFINPTPPVFNYPSSPAPQVTLSPQTLPAGTESEIDIQGTNTDFVNGMVTLGYGSSDVVVRGIWVLSPTHALANVQISPSAPTGPIGATVMSGFQVANQTTALQIAAPNPTLPVVDPALVNAVWAPSGVFAGSTANLRGTNLASGSPTTITIGGQSANVVSATSNLVTFVVPSGLKPGIQVLKLNNGSANASPIVVTLAGIPPAITGLQNATGAAVAAANAPKPGDTLTLQVAGLAAAGATIDPSTVLVTVGGVTRMAAVVSEVGTTSTYQVQFTLDASVPTGAQIPVTVSLNGKTSLPVYIPINAPA